MSANYPFFTSNQCFIGIEIVDCFKTNITQQTMRILFEKQVCILLFRPISHLFSCQNDKNWVYFQHHLNKTRSR